MIRNRASTLALGATTIAVALGCGSVGLLPPVEPGEVTVTLHLTGGIAGGDQTTVLSGEDRTVEVSCAAFCFGEEGTLPVSEAQLSAVATALDEAGTLDLDGTDFGTTCCDFIGAALTYEVRDRSATVSGTTDRFPAGLSPALDALLAMGSLRGPMLFAPESTPSEWPSDALDLGEVEASGGVLSVEVSYGGGCGQHRIDAVGWGGWMESFPVQINVAITHDDGDDPCDAVVTEERRFDLAPLRAAYEASYGPIGSERPTVVLRVRSAHGGDTVSVEVEL